MPVPVTCRQCGIVFEIPPSWVGKRAFHSPKCREDAKAERFRQHTRTCLNCGRKFVVPATRIRHGVGDKFHSQKCAGEAKRKPFAERLWQKIAVTNDDGCWEWQGMRNEHGYGRIWDDAHDDSTVSPLTYAHRAVYELTYGSLTPQDNVLHRCDNPPCCRPDHLWLGSHHDNTLDRDNKDRVRHGSAHRNAKLTEKVVRRIRALYDTQAISQRELAAMFNVSHQSISDALLGKTWKRA